MTEIVVAWGGGMFMGAGWMLVGTPWPGVGGLVFVVGAGLSAWAVSRKKAASPETVRRFITALYPDAPNLAMVAFDEETVLRFAAEQLEQRAEAEQRGYPDPPFDLAAIRCVCGRAQRAMAALETEGPGASRARAYCQFGNELFPAVEQLIALVEEAQELLVANTGSIACLYCDGDDKEHALSCPLAAWLAKVLGDAPEEEHR